MLLLLILSENLLFHNTSFETSLQMLLLVDMLGRNAAQPRNGASLMISICPPLLQEALWLGVSGSYVSSPCPFCVGWCAWEGSYVLGLFGLQRNLCGDQTAELHQLSKSPDTGITVFIKLVVVGEGDFFPNIIFIIFCLFSLFSNSLLRHPDD